MMFCLVISMSTYWMYAYKHKYGKNYFDNKIISYKVSDYVDTDGNYVYLKNIDKEIIKPIGTAIKAILRSNLIKYITLSTPTLVQASIVSAKTILILNNIKLIILNSKYLYLLIFYLTL
jgi:hypothetical protein